VETANRKLSILIDDVGSFRHVPPAELLAGGGAVDAESRTMMLDVLAALAALSDQVGMLGTKVSILIDTVGALRSEFNRGASPQEP
jgi:hypothetical protein